MIKNIFELNDFYVCITAFDNFKYGEIITKGQYEWLVLTSKEYRFVVLKEYYISHMLHACENIKQINDRHGVIPESDKQIKFLENYYTPTKAAFLTSVKIGEEIVEEIKIGDILFDVKHRRIGEVRKLPENSLGCQFIWFKAGEHSWASDYNDHTRLGPYTWPVLKVSKVN